MKRIYVPTKTADDWKELLADKNKHWVENKSAYELAHNWESAAQRERGLPEPVAVLLDGHDATHDARLLLALPEHKVAVEGRGFPSQTDLWALLRGPHGLISLAVEGKAGEPFGEIVQKWLGEPEGENRKARLTALCDTLNITIEEAKPLRYQLLHRAVSAILEANRFTASTAILLVQSFSGAEGLKDFKNFATCLGADVTNIETSLVRAKKVNQVEFYLAWLNCDFARSAIGTSGAL